MGCFIMDKYDLLDEVNMEKVNFEYFIRRLSTGYLASNASAASRCRGGQGGQSDLVSNPQNFAQYPCNRGVARSGPSIRFEVPYRVLWHLAF